MYELERFVMTTKQEKLDELGALAQMLLLRDGEIVPVLYMQSSTGVGMIGLINFGPSHEDRMRQLFDVGKELYSKNAGRLELVALLIEGWMVVTNDPKGLNGVTPSEHPDRIEIITVSGYDPNSGVSYNNIYQIIRNADGSVRDTAPYPIGEKGEFSNPLLESFTAGFYSSITKVN